MTGYEIYCLCRFVMHRSKVKAESFEKSSDRSFYQMLADAMMRDLKLTKKEVYDYIKVNYCRNPNTFQPYELLTETCQEYYRKWLKEQSTVPLYLNFVNKSFTFIENFCLKNNIDFDEYKYKYSQKHLREEKIDGAVAVYLSFVDRRKLRKIDKLLLKKFLNEYNIIEQRIRKPELKTLLERRSKEMFSLIGTSLTE
jgi:hypothetical protein